MREAAARFPGYGLEAHKGYPSPSHRTCLTDLGPTPIHRRSYAPGVACARAALWLIGGQWAIPMGIAPAHHHQLKVN